MSSRSVGREAAARLASDILIAYLGSHTVSSTELPDLLGRLMSTLAGPAEAEPAQQAVVKVLGGGEGAVPDKASEAAGTVTAAPADDDRIAASIHDDYLISFEDGKPYRSLRRHLMSKYGLTPEQYRAKWGLPVDYPMVAPSYARERSEVAKRIGLGRNDQKHPEPQRRRGD